MAGCRRSTRIRPSTDTSPDLVQLPPRSMPALYIIRYIAYLYVVQIARGEWRGVRDTKAIEKL